jgi:hypothetical protein
MSARLRVSRVLALAVVAVRAEWNTHVTPLRSVTIGRGHQCHTTPGGGGRAWKPVPCLYWRQHVRGGSPREGARSEPASGAATGGGGPQAPRPGTPTGLTRPGTPTARRLPRPGIPTVLTRPGISSRAHPSPENLLAKSWNSYAGLDLDYVLLGPTWTTSSLGLLIPTKMV